MKRRKEKTERHGAGGTGHKPLDAQRQRQLIETVVRLAEPVCSAEGLELVHVEYQREPGGLTLRLYLDKPGGVALDDCVEVSRQLTDILDVHLADAPPYHLEVSSPGLDRPLGKIADFVRFSGRRARIRVIEAVDGRKNFTGILAGVVDETIQLKLDKETIGLRRDNIQRARLINDYGED